MQVCCPFIAAILWMLIVIQVDGFTDLSLTAEDQRVNGAHKRDVQITHFTLKIQVQGAHASLQRFIEESKFLIEKHADITDSLVTVDNTVTGGFPNRGEQGENVMIIIKGKGTEASANRLAQEINDLLSKNSEIIHSSTNTERIESTSSCNMGVHFTLSIQGEGDEASLRRLVKEINDFLTRNGQINDYVVNQQGQGNAGMHFTVTIQGKGTDASLMRLVESTSTVLQRDVKMTNISISIQGQGIGSSVHEFIRNLNVSLNKGCDLDVPAPGVGGQFTLQIQAVGSAAAQSRLVQEINAGLVQEKQITDYFVNTQEHGKGNKQTSFKVTITGKGTEASLMRFLQIINAALRREGEISHITLSIQAQGIGRSLQQLIYEINVSLKNKKSSICCTQ